MDKKKMIPCLYLKDGKLYEDFTDEKTVSDAPVDYAKKCCNSGADMLIIFDQSYDDASHEEALHIMRNINREIDIPVIGAGNIDRTEDVKKILYAGCSAAALNLAKQGNIELIEEVSKRFSKDKIMVCADAEEQVLESIDRIREYTSGVLLLDDKIVDSYRGLHMVPVTEDSGHESAKRILTKECVIGISGRFANDNIGNLMKIKRELKEDGIETCIFNSPYTFDDFKKNTDGHVTVVVQDYKTDEVLMVAYMNEEAYNKTIETGIMTYYSRSRNELWVKGETSGHYQYVKSLTADCDMDTILAKVAQIGNACHTGSYSCFFNEIVKTDAADTNPFKVFEKVYDVIIDRRNNPKEGSYTNYLFDKGIDKILKKVGEEATEIVIAAKNPDKEEVKYEIADFLYHVMVLMAECGLDWTDIVKELADR
ncbi:MAG: bifunctional phosphoribosyl-AMP cyclohydrolase/phosphoribosyl-ATP diphosphatase HisIE [Lachnospiraceae bacterium]|nr:bifunctional phosphoribosyl-AMP cyclohydrolase/phosphoribosyl-ATP diphosphatase HisIE [Lachnospiraceae bacterium]